MNKVDLEEKQERRMRYGFLALLLLVLGGIHFMDPAFYPTVYQLSKSGDLGGTITFKGYLAFTVQFNFHLDCFKTNLYIPLSILSLFHIPPYGSIHDGNNNNNDSQTQRMFPQMDHIMPDNHLKCH